MAKKIDWLDRAIITGPYLCLVLDDQAYQEAMAAFDVPEPDRGPWVNRGAMGTTHHVLAGDGRRGCIVSMHDWQGRDPIEVAGLLIHEAVHVWQSARDDMMREDKPGSETEAYAVQWIAQQLMWSFREQTEGKR